MCGCCFVVCRARCHIFVSLVHRVRGRLRTWRSQSHLTRKPNLWRPVSVQQRQLCLSRNFLQRVNSSPLSLIFHWPAGSSTGSIKARFENIAKQKEEEDKKRAEEERARRQAKEKQEQEEARRKIEETPRAPSPVPAASPSPTPPAQPASAPTYEVSHGGLQTLCVLGAMTREGWRKKGAGAGLSSHFHMD